MCIICNALPSANNSNVTSGRDLGSFLDPTCSIASWNDREVFGSPSPSIIRKFICGTSTIPTLLAECLYKCSSSFL